MPRSLKKLRNVTERLAAATSKEIIDITNGAVEFDARTIVWVVCGIDNSVFRGFVKIKFTARGAIS